MSSNENLLSQLRDIRVPAAPEASPISLLVVITGVLALVLLILLIAILWRNHRKSWLKQNLAELQQFKCRLESIDQTGQPEEELSSLAQLLRRYVARLQPADQRYIISGLNGRKWQEFLNTTFATRFFTEGEGRLFGNALYTGEIQTANTQTTDRSSSQSRNQPLIQICDQLEILFKDHHHRSTLKSRRMRKQIPAQHNYEAN